MYCVVKRSGFTMKKYIRSEIATSLILGQLILGNMCCAGNYTSKTWQEKSVEKLQSFAREIKSSIKADPGWWLAGGTIGLAALVASPFVVNHFRQMPKNFKQEFESIKNYYTQYQTNIPNANSAAALAKILTFEKLDKTVKVVCKDYKTKGIKLPSITDTNVRLYYDFCVGANYNLPELLDITDEFLNNSKRKLIFIGGIYPNNGAELKDLLSVYLMCLLRLSFPNRVFLVSHKSDTRRPGYISIDPLEDIIKQFNDVFATTENLDEILLGNTPELEYLPDKNFMENMNGQEIAIEQTPENEFKKIYNNLGDSSYIPAQNLKNAIDTASDLMEDEEIIIEFSNNNTVFVASDIHGDYSCLKFVIDKFLSSEDSKLVFLGDYIHRGKSDLQVLYLLCMLKICYPKRVYLLRGNHEERNNSISQQTSFDAALDSIYSETSDLKDSLDKLSKSMPLAAIVNNTFYCVHGGINPKVPLSTLRRLDKDLLWNQNGINTEVERRGRGLYIPYTNEFAIYSALWGIPENGNYYRDWTSVDGKPHYSPNCVNKFLNEAGLKCLVHGHNHKNEVDFENQKSVSVRTNPMNWKGQVNNKSVGLVEIKNNHLTLQKYTYPKLETLKSKIVDKYY